jgi:uncharacterized protein
LAACEDVLPFRQFVLKVHSRCDLACDHCYVYEHADQSWHGRPAVISPETVAKAGERIAEHARAHGLPAVRVILHGGEPLLAGAPRLGSIVRDLRRAIEPACRLDLRIHTNGVRLDSAFCELFRTERVKVGISLDGDRIANDLHRRYRDGRSSYDQVLRAVAMLRQERYRVIYAGLLATVDIRSDPVEVYRALAALEPPNLDFLLPHGTWDSPPPGAGVPGTTRYADWLAAVFAEWNAEGRRVPVRMFESIISTTAGGVSGTESLGLAPSDVAVIETDGTIEQADSIKVAYDGAPVTGLDVFAHPLDVAAAHPAIRARQRGMAGLSATCRGCHVVTSCGGGLYAHRYRTGSGFLNPSVYCADLEKIITHVRQAEARRPGHKMPEAQFDALASGYGDGESLAQLSAAQQSLRRTLLRLLREELTGNAAFTAGWELLVQLDRSSPGALNEVLAHPYVRAWAERCLTVPGTAVTDGGHLASIAAAAAVSSGTVAEIGVPVADGYVHLPTLGRLRVGGAGPAVLTVRGAAAFEVRATTGRWRVDVGAGTADPDWEPVRLLRAGDRTVRLEDTDPFRDCHEWPPAERLTAAEAAAWQAQFAQAWSLIEGTYPAYADGIAAGLSVLTPLANEAADREISATARSAFGAVAIARPATGADLALLVIHEFQHVKLGAIIDMFDLYSQTENGLFFAPWREEPRPLGALLQGTYAHLAVTDFWRLRRHALGGQAAADAAERFARWRMLTAEAANTLLSTGALTPLGIRFVQGMNATVGGWLGERVSEEAEAAARRWAAECRERWRRQAGR